MKNLTLPEKLVTEIAQSVDSGYMCFVNLKNQEIIKISGQILENPDEIEETFNMSYGEFSEKYLFNQDVLTVKPLESHDTFDIMINFVDQLQDQRLKSKLDEILGKRHPFAHFRDAVDHSEFKDNWLNFKQQMIENHINNIFNSMSAFPPVN